MIYYRLPIRTPLTPTQKACMLPTTNTRLCSLGRQVAPTCKPVSATLGSQQ